jgi:hypothetical protein
MQTALARAGACLRSRFGSIGTRRRAHFVHPQPPGRNRGIGRVGLPFRCRCPGAALVLWDQARASAGGRYGLLVLGRSRYGGREARARSGRVHAPRSRANRDGRAFCRDRRQTAWPRRRCASPERVGCLLGHWARRGECLRAGGSSPASRFAGRRSACGGVKGAGSSVAKCRNRQAQAAREHATAYVDLGTAGDCDLAKIRIRRRQMVQVLVFQQSNSLIRHRTAGRPPRSSAKNVPSAAPRAVPT